MLKSTHSLKISESSALQALQALLSQIPAIRLLESQQEPGVGERGADLVVPIEAFGKHHLLVCEWKSLAQPRHVRASLSELRYRMSRDSARDATPVLLAPYLSIESQALCREQGVSFLDLEGNARLVFDGVYIERQVASKPAIERRQLKSLFKPKSAQVLRVLFRNPGRAWRVAELAQAAAVSLGHISNVRTELLAREWAQLSDEGLYLCAPDALLDAWRDDYEPPAGEQLTFYTTLHGSAFEDAVRQALRTDAEQKQAALASFSAAHWLAPYGRVGSQYFYADDAGLERLQSSLILSPISKGENVVITRLRDIGVLRDIEEPAPGAICTSPLQTYLDLANAGERGQEAADHLRRERLQWRE